MEGNRIADEVLVSTGIYDSVSKEPYAGYVVIKGDSILEVGRGQVPDKYRKPSIPVHDYGDATICAGFGDTHTFFTGCIIDNLGIDLTGIEDLEQLEVVVRKELSAKKGKAVFGNHLSPALAGQSQTEECLNAWSPDVPVVLFIPGHGTCAMNQKAREEYGFSPEACYAEALYKIMGIYLNDRDFVDDQLVEYMHMLNARGVTSVKEMGFDDFYGFTDVLKEFDDQKKLTLRISFMSQPVGAPANIAYAGVMIMPDTVSPGLATVVSLLPSMVAMMLYGVIWSGLRECKFKAAYFGTVIGIGSILGYTPDFFYFTIFGKWMDTYGNAAYKMIFGFLMATAVLGMILAVIMRVLISRNKMKVEE